MGYIAVMRMAAGALDQKAPTSSSSPQKRAAQQLPPGGYGASSSKGGGHKKQVQVPQTLLTLWLHMATMLTRFGPHAEFSILVYAPEGDMVLLLGVIDGALRLLWSMRWVEFRARANSTAGPASEAASPDSSSHLARS